MSWQDYVDNQLLASQCVSKAAIAGHDGGIWAKSDGFEVSTRYPYVRFNIFVPESFANFDSKSENHFHTFKL